MTADSKREMAERSTAVLYQVQGAIARIVLNRPEKRNALNEDLIVGLKDALRSADQDENVRAAILTGAGPDFCSGADLEALKKISEASVTENLEDARSLMELFTLIRSVRVPVIAAVRGRALAGGCGLALACDMVLASSSSKFGFPEVKIGFVPAMVMAILRRNVSEKRAFELITLGDQISSDEAVALGLINYVFDDEAFEDGVGAFARRFVDFSGSAVSLSKRLLYRIDGLALEGAMSAGADINSIARMTDDCKKGIDRFLKRE
jgi:methylglutaconyl-CoA hydratase